MLSKDRVLDLLWPPGAAHNHCIAQSSSIGLRSLRTLLKTRCSYWELTGVLPPVPLHLELSTVASAYHLFEIANRCDRRHHGEPHAIKPIPEREAAVAPLRQIPLALSSTIARLECTEATAEGAASRGLPI